MRKDTAPTDLTYIAHRIQALTRKGAIKALRDEAATSRQAARNSLGDRPAYDTARRFIDRAAAFDNEAERLDRERPAGAAGLES